MSDSLSKKFLDKAKTLEQYFLHLWEEQKQPLWLAGLEASHEWVSHLEKGESIEQTQVLLERLDKERSNHGSGWLDLCSEVRRWIYAQENGNESGRLERIRSE